MKTLGKKALTLAVAAVALSSCTMQGNETRDLGPSDRSGWYQVEGPYGETVWCYSFDDYQEAGITCLREEQ